MQNLIIIYRSALLLGVQRFIFLVVQFDFDYCVSISIISIQLIKCFLILITYRDNMQP